MTNNQKTGELCTVSPSTLGFTAADFEVSRQLVTFLRSMLPQGAEAMFQMGSTEEGFSGVPVRRVANVLGRETISEMTGVSRRTFPTPPSSCRPASPARLSAASAARDAAAGRAPVGTDCRWPS